MYLIYIYIYCFCNIYLFLDNTWLVYGVISTTFNNISAISWQSVLLVEILNKEIMQSSYDYFVPSEIFLETKDL